MWRKGTGCALKGKGTIIFILAGLAALWMGIYHYGCLKDKGDRISLRYDSPSVSGAQLLRYQETKSAEAEQTGGENKAANIELTAWRQDKNQTVMWKEMKKTSVTDVVRVYGSMSEALPFPFISGGYSFQEDSSGCYISKETASSLFGTKQAAGLPVQYQGSTYLVRGILDTERPIFAIYAEKEEQLPYLEVHNRRGGSMEAVKNTLTGDLGLFKESSYTDVSFYAALLRFALSIPLWVIYFAALMKFKKAKFRFAWAGYLIFAALFAAGLMFSIQFGPDFIPTKWSDFTFWADKFQKIWENEKNRAAFGSLYPEQEIMSHFKAGIIMAAGTTLAELLAAHNMKKSKLQQCSQKLA